jgi:octaprenyl-diphosphate synthase
MMHGVIILPSELEPLSLFVASTLRRVEGVFDRQLASDLPPVRRLVRHVEHYRGKLLRPTLTVVCGLAAHPRAGETPPDAIIGDDHVTIAAVCEMVHMATLVHDDVLDEADVRRRGATVNRLHGNEAAVILGDYLIAGAYHLCSTLRAREGENWAALAIGRASMVTCAGELLQLHHREDFSLDEATYFEIVSRKTGDLIATAAELGARCSGAGDAAAGAIRRFAMGVGVAFQVQDDLLDLLGREAVVGKSVGKDMEKGKVTLPLIHHLRRSGQAQRGRSLLLLEAASAGHSHESDPALDHAELLAALESTGSIVAAREQAQRRIDEAKRELAALADSPAKGLLLAMADAVLTRAH